MEQYIPKAAVVAELERLRKIQPTNEFQPKEQNKIDWLAGKEFAIITLQVFLDTLEVKDVNLEEEIDKFYGMHRKNGITFSIEDNQECLDWKVDCNPNFVKAFAKHFFELGLKTKRE